MDEHDYRKFMDAVDTVCIQCLYTTGCETCAVRRTADRISDVMRPVVKRLSIDKVKEAFDKLHKAGRVELKVGGKDCINIGCTSTEGGEWHVGWFLSKDGKVLNAWVPYDPVMAFLMDGPSYVQVHDEYTDETKFDELMKRCEGPNWEEHW